MKRPKITVVGSGYVGMSLSVLLAQHNDVTVLDVDAARVDRINDRKSTVVDTEIELFLAEKALSLTATLDNKLAYQGARFIIVATPTNYDPVSNRFDTRAVDAVVRDALSLNENALVIIKSTIPVGHTKSLQKKFDTERVIFSPEFLREGRALQDNLYPSRIVVGSYCKAGSEFADLLKNAAEKLNIETILTGSNEAEAVKLFANTFLAMRVSFFNEMDSYGLVHDLNMEEIINGVCLDDRIGGGYNPSFGYGGYCLPKDTKQLLASYNGVPQSLIQAVVSSNAIRKKFIPDQIASRNPRCVGFYRLVMKQGSDNFRESSVQDVIMEIKSKGIHVVIFEPSLSEDSFLESPVIKDISEFKSVAEIIVTNRVSNQLSDVQEKVFSRDIFREN